MCVFVLPLSAVRSMRINFIVENILAFLILIIALTSLNALRCTFSSFIHCVFCCLAFDENAFFIGIAIVVVVAVALLPLSASDFVVWQVIIITCYNAFFLTSAFTSSLSHFIVASLVCLHLYLILFFFLFCPRMGNSSFSVRYL